MAYYDSMIHKILNHLGKKDIKILDFGCGAGFFIRRAWKLNINAVGIDFSPYAQLAKVYFDLEIEVCDISETKFEANSFDAEDIEPNFFHSG